MPQEAPRAVVLMHPATAVPEGLYAAFSRYLCGEGFAVVTYDYRGIGRSMPAGGLRGADIRMRDWALLDVAAVTRWAKARFETLPILAVGHSVGGHGIGLNDTRELVDAAVLVTTHVAYLPLIEDRKERIRATIALQKMAPLLVKVIGYLPGRLLGGEDLPRGVLEEWSAWTRLPRYFFDDPSLDAARRFAACRFPVLVVGVDDDLWATPTAVGALAEFFTGTALTRRQFSPEEAGGPIGHLGFFRSRFQPTLWPEIGAWLHARLDALPSSGA